jgi:hypothetical protein
MFLLLFQMWYALAGPCCENCCDWCVLTFNHVGYRYRAAILTEFHKLRSHRIPGAPFSAAESADFPVLHLRRRASDWSSFVRLSSLFRSFSVYSLLLVLSSWIACSALSRVLVMGGVSRPSLGFVNDEEKFVEI